MTRARVLQQRVRVYRADVAGPVLRRYAVRMPDGSLETCPFCTSTSGTDKVVFDDRADADAAAAELDALPSARGRLRTHRCRVWRDVWHLTGAQWDPTRRKANR